MSKKFLNTTDVYDCDAESVAATYESFPFTNVHQDVLDLLPESPGLVLDIGAGYGHPHGAGTARPCRPMPTMVICTHVLGRGAQGVSSPLDAL